MNVPAIVAEKVAGVAVVNGTEILLARKILTNMNELKIAVDEFNQALEKYLISCRDLEKKLRQFK